MFVITAGVPGLLAANETCAQEIRSQPSDENGREMSIPSGIDSIEVVTMAGDATLIILMTEIDTTGATNRRTIIEALNPPPPHFIVPFLLRHLSLSLALHLQLVHRRIGLTNPKPLVRHLLQATNTSESWQPAEADLAVGVAERQTSAGAPLLETSTRVVSCSMLRSRQMLSRHRAGAGDKESRRLSISECPLSFPQCQLPHRPWNHIPSHNLNSAAKTRGYLIKRRARNSTTTQAAMRTKGGGTRN